MNSGISTAHSVVEPTARTRVVAGVLVALYAFITIVPLAWIFMTGFKTQSDAISYPPKVIFTPGIDGYCNLFTTRSRQTPEYIAALPPASSACEQKARDINMVVAGPSNYIPRFINSLVIAVGWASWRRMPSRASRSP
jgi:multiple sugar transport system permease protein